MVGPNGTVLTPVSSSDSGSDGDGGGSVPIAVVWCRQVDNEAESPGYTTIPEEFPGHRETLDTIRIVGNLTINVADTHDYWDPDPTQPLSYYPNLFLYPAHGGRYTCVGRMFLSTEDRPRLGMKTLVLETAQLLKSGEFGPTVLRWHASMGGGQRDGSRVPPNPDPALYAAVGEGFLFHRGSTEPVLLIASDQWEATVQAILDLIRVLPTSLIALGAVLAFPYFLPEPKTNVHEMIEQLPLALAVMRVARNEAQGDRYDKRISSWESAPVTVRDLTRGLPPTPKGKETTPLILQYVRDHRDEKILQVSQRVDLVELSRLQVHLSDPERQGGKDHRKEMWRIGTAMESAALLLQKPRGRQITMSHDTAKRAGEYLRARVRESGEEGEVRAPSAGAAPVLDTALSRGLPPWLQRSGETPGSSPVNEVVPVSVSDDPSLRRLDPSPSTSIPPPSVTPAPEVRPRPPSGVGAIPYLPPPPTLPMTVDVKALRQEVERDLIRYVDERLVAFRERLQPAIGPTEMKRAAAAESRIAQIETQTSDRISKEVAESESRLADKIAKNAAATSSSQVSAAEAIRVAVERRLSDVAELHDRAISTISAQLSQRISDIEARVSNTGAVVGTELDRRLKTVVEPRIQEASQRLQESVRVTSTSLANDLGEKLTRSMDAIRSDRTRAEEKLRTGLSTQFDLQLKEAQEREVAARQSVEARVREVAKDRFSESEQRRSKEMKELEQRLELSGEGRLRDSEERNSKRLAESEQRVTKSQEKWIADIESRLLAKSGDQTNEIEEAHGHQIAELQVRMQSYTDQKLRESQDREREKYLELLARLRSDVDASMAKLVDSPRIEQTIRERVTRGIDSLRSENQRLVESQVLEVQGRLREGDEQGLQRLEQIETRLGQREKDLLRVEQSVRGDLADLDRRTQLLADRLVPVVRQAWLKIAEYQKSAPNTEDSELRLKEIRREFARELRRVEGEFLEQTQEIRTRMENAISSQGRVWLTLVRQLTQLTENRRAMDQQSSRAAGGSPQDALDLSALGELSETLFARAGQVPPPPPVNPLDPEIVEETTKTVPDEDRSTRRRARRP